MSAGPAQNPVNTKYSLRRMRNAISRRFLETVGGSSSHFENQVYIASRKSQLDVLFASVSPVSLQGKTVLEVGCGHGHLGAELEKLGARVISTDARAENVRQTIRKFPGREAYVCDACSPDMAKFGPVDIVFAIGLLYHLPCPAEFLASCSKIADTLLLESAVMDVLEPEIWFRKETRFWAFYDQSVHSGGCRPSPAWVERELRSNGYNHVIDLCSDESKWEGMNAPAYTWRVSGTGTGRRFGDPGNRRMWAAAKTAIRRQGDKIILS